MGAKEALQAMLFTPWAPHLNLLGRPHVPSPAYKGPIAVGDVAQIHGASQSKTKTEASREVRDVTGDAAVHETPAPGGASPRTVWTFSLLFQCRSS